MELEPQPEFELGNSDVADSLPIVESDRMDELMARYDALLEEIDAVGQQIEAILSSLSESTPLGNESTPSV